MASLADSIAAYIQGVMQERRDAPLEIQRSELSEQFGCAPSQINYVLETRFTIERGYLIESRRGGGGYIRITRVRCDKQEELFALLQEYIGSRLSQAQGSHLLGRLAEEGLLNTSEEQLLQGIIDRQVLACELPERDRLRARIMKSVFLTLLKRL